MPFVHSQRLHATFAEGDESALPHALICGIIAHSTSYIPEIRTLHRSLWQQALLALEDEYRKPRLRTLQLALLILTSRPSENVGQREIGVARVSLSLSEKLTLGGRSGSPSRPAHGPELLGTAAMGEVDTHAYMVDAVRARQMAGSSLWTPIHVSWQGCY